MCKPRCTNKQERYDTTIYLTYSILDIETNKVGGACKSCVASPRPTRRQRSPPPIYEPSVAGWRIPRATLDPIDTRPEKGGHTKHTGFALWTIPLSNANNTERRLRIWIYPIYIYSKTSLTDHLYRSTTSPYRSLYLGPN